MVSFDNGQLRVRFLTALIIAPISLIIIYYGSWPFLIFLALVFAISISEWLNIAKRLGNIFIYFSVGLLYLSFCFYCFLMVGMEKSIDALLLLLLVAFSDIGAYFAGKTIGGPKMAPKISPNKTWAGFIGAVLSPAIALIIAEVFFLDGVVHGPHKYLLFFIFGCLIGLFGQIGDVLVSLSKRRAGVKDTGSLLPGHGGVLDRIDSLLLASPIFMILEYVMGHV